LEATAVSDHAPWLVLVLVLIVAGLGLLAIFRRRSRPVREDRYTQGLELWLAGDMAGALAALHEAVRQQPQSIDPYLQLGNLLRLTGDPRRAAALHRGLTVRADVPAGKRPWIALALADDLLALQRWEEAGDLLAAVQERMSALPRYWRLRFTQALGAGDGDGAAAALEDGARRCNPDESARFRRQHDLLQLDRALTAVRAGDRSRARSLLKRVKGEGDLAARRDFVRALIAAQEDDTERAVSLATAGLMGAPQEMSLFLPTLQELLLQSGRYERTIPILESASRSEESPPSLWMTLALLYEKLGEREKAFALLEDKAQDPRLTPNAAAPYLRLLAGENQAQPISRLWGLLHLPQTDASWQCGNCGMRQPGVRWFCPGCYRFETYAAMTR
jgi:lipopolysaccharide biosynthesis regulator YciM